MVWFRCRQRQQTRTASHHEFNLNNAARRNNIRVDKLLNYFDLIGNPFRLDANLRNVCSGSSIADNAVEGILSCLQVGEASNHEYIQTRLVEKSCKLHVTISSNKNIAMPIPMVGASESLQAKTIGFQSDIADAMRFICYARERGYDFQKHQHHTS